ncbi:hypothetical protein BDR26DRAFT_870887 [Obelidium mucronatum]|nr:hypothetical protein BDR26DRAFT_870887 [Obelidium mucronatum]
MAFDVIDIFQERLVSVLWCLLQSSSKFSTLFSSPIYLTSQRPKISFFNTLILPMIASPRDSPSSSSSVIYSSNGSNFVGSSVSSPFSVSSFVSAMGLIVSSSMSFLIFAHCFSPFLLLLLPLPLEQPVSTPPSDPPLFVWFFKGGLFLLWQNLVGKFFELWSGFCLRLGLFVCFVWWLVSGRSCL